MILKKAKRVEAPSPTSNPATIIFLHEYGYDADGWTNIATQFHTARKLPHLTWLFPNTSLDRKSMRTAWYTPISTRPWRKAVLVPFWGIQVLLGLLKIALLGRAINVVNGNCKPLWHWPVRENLNINLPVGGGGIRNSSKGQRDQNLRDLLIEPSYILDRLERGG